jgi:hypothetical protein
VLQKIKLTQLPILNIFAAQMNMHFLQRIFLTLLVTIACFQFNVNAQDTLVLCSPQRISKSTKNIIVSDYRDYKKEIGKLKSLTNGKWQKLHLSTDFTKTMEGMNDSLAQQLNMTQPYRIVIRSLYVQENTIRGSSMRYARLVYCAEYYIQNKDLSYSLMYTADTSVQIESYLLTISIATEFKILLRHSLVQTKNSLAKEPGQSIAQISTRYNIPPSTFDLFTETRNDGIFNTWDELLSLQPMMTQCKISCITGIGQLNLKDTTTNKKSKLSIFSLYAFLQQGILYKCTKYGSFPLINVNNNYYYVGYHESFLTKKQDQYAYKKVKKKGGLSLSQDDIESQKYVFKINPTNGKSIVVCSLTPKDDYNTILFNLSNE